MEEGSDDNGKNIRGAKGSRRRHSASDTGTDTDDRDRHVYGRPGHRGSDTSSGGDMEAGSDDAHQYSNVRGVKGSSRRRSKESGDVGGRARDLRGRPAQHGSDGSADDDMEKGSDDDGKNVRGAKGTRQQHPDAPLAGGAQGPKYGKYKVPVRRRPERRVSDLSPERRSNDVSGTGSSMDGATGRTFAVRRARGRPEPTGC
eukprot:TRINITY_DN4046_c0_g1_i1.p5 TRINITY_DN4046_c0_g1~~TRINITY_DN4046_c0_g1_i1.p5  ORF type:complete len:201 (+),score=33.05 TRINITY_DN4046_c0_g1_i1:3-605(+)